MSLISAGSISLDSTFKEPFSAKIFRPSFRENMSKRKMCKNNEQPLEINCYTNALLLHGGLFMHPLNDIIFIKYSSGVPVLLNPSVP